jgi:ubiquinone/menaquinone biosynthesis C-methylase UbiE
LHGWAAEKRIVIPSAVRIFKDFFIANINDDLIGAFYQSAQSVSAKSKCGSFYTPSVLLRDIRIPPGKKVLDPCCGSGSILLQVLTKTHAPDHIFAWDIDDTAL